MKTKFCEFLRCTRVFHFALTAGGPSRHQTALFCSRHTSYLTNTTAICRQSLRFSAWYRPKVSACQLPSAGGEDGVNAPTARASAHGADWSYTSVVDDSSVGGVDTKRMVTDRKAVKSIANPIRASDDLKCKIYFLGNI